MSWYLSTVDHLLGEDGEAGGEDDNPFDQVFQLLQVLQSKDISLTPNVNTFIAAKTWQKNPGKKPGNTWYFIAGKTW